MDNDKITQEPTAKAPEPERGKVMTGKIWTFVVLFVLVLLALIIFLAQNSEEVKISFLGSHGHLSLAITMLVSALAGAVLVILAGSARILQLRHFNNRRNSKNN